MLAQELTPKERALHAAIGRSYVQVREALAGLFVSHGASGADARDLDVAVISTLDGAVAQARAARSQTALLSVGRTLDALLQAYGVD